MGYCSSDVRIVTVDSLSQLQNSIVLPLRQMDIGSIAKGAIVIVANSIEKGASRKIPHITALSMPAIALRSLHIIKNIT